MNKLTTVLFIFGLIAGLESRFRVNENEGPQVIFHNVGEIITTSGVVHVVMDFKVKELAVQCENLKKKMEFTLKDNPLLEDTITEVARAQLEEACNIPNSILSDVRKRRSLAAFAAGVFGAITGVLGLISVHHLSGRVDNIEKIQDKTILQLSKEHTRIDQLQNLTSSLSREFHAQYTILHTDVDSLRWSTRVAAGSAWIHQQTKDFENGVANLLATHRLSMPMLNIKRLEQLWRVFSLHLKKMGGVSAPLEGPLDLLQVPASFIVTDQDVLRVFIHVPIVDRTLTAFRYKPMPIRLGNTEARWVVEMTDPQQKTTLALDTRQPGLFIELDRDTLELECWELGRKRVCDKMHTFHLAKEESCLYSLFTAEVERASKRCRLETSHRTWAVEQVEEDKFASFVLHSKPAKVACPNGSIETVHLEGFQTWTLKECRLEADDFTISPAVDRGEIRDKVTYPLQMKLPAFLASVPDGKWKELQQELEQMGVRQPQVTRSLHELVEEVEERSRSRRASLWLWLSIIIVGFIAVGLGAFLGILYCRARQMKVTE